MSGVVYDLSSQYLYPSGLMQALFNEDVSDAENLQHRIVADLKEKGNMCGSNGHQLATECFLWLEAHDRPADILTLGKHCTHQLELFLKVIKYFLCIKLLLSPFIFYLLSRNRPQPNALNIYAGMGVCEWT